MRNRSAIFRTVVLMGTLALFTTLSACDDDDDVVGPSAKGTVVVLLHEAVGNQDLVRYDGDPNNILYENAAGNTYGVDLFEYLLSNFSVSATGKRATSYDFAHYRNAFNANTAVLTLDGVNTGSYDTLSFWWGVPDAQNVNGALPAQFDFLLWPMGTAGGYHCSRFEGPYTAGDGDFTLHMGRLTTSDGTSTSGHQQIVLPVDFDVHAGESTVLVLTLDLNALLNDPLIDFTATAGTMPLDGPTMPNHAAQALMRDNMDDVFSATAN